MQQLITSTYEHQLANAYFKIDQRGILTDAAKLKTLDQKITAEINTRLTKLSDAWGVQVYLGKDNDPGSGDRINLNSKGKLLDFLKQRGFKILKVRKKNQETREFEHKESLEELAIRKMFAEAPPNQVEELKTLLDISEYNTLQIRYVRAKKHDDVFYYCYNVAGTTTGRRSCKKNAFGLGGNAQNFPEHSNNPLVHDFRDCLIARSGKLFFFVDQMSAEEWPVSALSQNKMALTELQQQVDRHTKFAAFIFGIPIDSKTKKEWKESIERYLGKKCRHAKNYRMQAQMMSDSLAKEGYSVSVETCKNLLNKASAYDPSIEGVFHQYVINELFSKRKLVTPLGRERFFLGLRPNDDNHKIVNEACAFIPQSTVGDNTGLAVLYLATNHDAPIIHECHDSIGQEIDDNWNSLLTAFRNTQMAFDRTITFDNGISIRIPIEAKLGYSFGKAITLPTYTEEALKEAYDRLKEEQQQKQQREEHAATQGSLATGLSGVC